MKLKKKKRNSDAEAAQDLEPKKAVKATRKKQNAKTHMSSVLQDNVPEVAYDRIRHNEAFIVTQQDENGEMDEIGIGLLLNVSDIGGLNKTTKDAAHGQLIQAISNSKMETLITPEMLEAEQIIFIPDEQTLGLMAEYTILQQKPDGSPVPYYVVMFTQNCQSMLMTDNTVTLDQAAAVINGNSREKLGEFLQNAGFDIQVRNADDLGGMEEETVQEAAVPESVMTEPEEPVQEPFGTEQEAMPEGGYSDGDLWVDEPAVPAVMEQEPAEVQETYMEPVVQAPALSGGFMPVNKEMLDQILYNQDLGIQISSYVDRFDKLLKSQEQPLPEFKISDDIQWLRQYIEPKVTTARVTIESMRANVRNTYAQAVQQKMSQALQKFMTDTDLTSTHNPYGMAMTRLQKEYQERLRNTDKGAEKARRVLEMEYQKKLKEAGEAARTEAENAYARRYGKQHQYEMDHVQDKIEDAVYREFYEEQNRIVDLRRQNIAEAMENTYIQLQEKMVPYLQVDQDKELQMVERLQADIERKTEENKARDIDAMNVALTMEETEKERIRMAEEYSKKIIQIHQDQEAERQNLRSQYDLELQSMKKKLEENENSFLMREDSLKQKLDEAKKNSESLQNNLDTIQERSRSIEAEKLETQRKVYESQLSHQRATFKGYMILGVIAMLCLAMLAWMAGTMIGQQNGINQAKSQLEYDINAQLKNQLQRNSD